MRWVTTIWILGLVGLVPYSVYYLIFLAAQDQYALIMVFILFWIFGYWAIAGPLISLLTVRRVFVALQSTRTRDRFQQILNGEPSRDAIIDLLVTENRIPRFIATIIYAMARKKLAREHET